MGLIRKRDRSDRRASSEAAAESARLSVSNDGAWKDHDGPEGAGENGGGTADRHGQPFPRELRLAVEAVAESDPAAAHGTGSDAYGLRAELQASRKRGDERPGEPELEPLRAGSAAALVDPDEEPVDALGDREPEPEAQLDDELPRGRGADRVEEPVVVEDEPEAGADEEPEAGAHEAPAARDRLPSKDDGPIAGTAGGSFKDEARARLDALERSLVEKTETIRERAAELAERESELARTGNQLDELETRFAERERELEELETRLAERERDLETREEALRAEAERLEEEQAIWGEATRESRSRLSEQQEAVEAREAQLAEVAEAHEARATELDRIGAELDARADRISVAEDDLAAQVKELDDRESALRLTEDGLAERERRLSERETAIAGREAALDQSEAGVTEREESFEEREADLVAREEALAADREQLERDRADWEEIMGGAFSRLSELETDLVSSLSLAGMLKRELEGRETSERRDRKSSGASRRESGERRGSRSNGGADADEAVEPVLAALDSNGSSIPKGDSNPEQQAVETDWWARQLGRRKKD